MLARGARRPAAGRRVRGVECPDVTRYGRSPWVDAFPKSRLPSYPSQRGPLQTDAIVVGGGMTGCLAAYVLSAAGVKVALVEAEQIGRGSSGRSLGWIADDPGLPFRDVEKALGRKAARHAFRAWHRAALDFGALVRRLDVKCRLEAQGTLLVVATPEQLSALAKERKSRIDAGLEAPALNPRTIAGEAGVEAAGGVRRRDGFTLDPYRAVLGLAGEAARRGAAIFERSPVRRIKFNRKSVEVRTAAGSIRAAHVIVATGTPTALFKALTRHFWFKSAFLVQTAPIPAKIRSRLGTRASVLRDSTAPPHIVRWQDERLLVSGADAEAPPARLLDRMLVQRTGQLMYELSTMYPDMSGVQPDYGWSAPYAQTADGLPYIGPHRNYPHHLFAFGDASASLTSAYLAARVLLRQVLAEPDAADEVFGFNRYGNVR